MIFPEVLCPQHLKHPHSSAFLAARSQPPGLKRRPHQRKQCILRLLIFRPLQKPPEGFFIFVTVHLSHAPFMIYLYFSELFAKNQHQIMASSIIHPES